MEYYTYAYLREDGTPYYIGKGEKDRIYKKGKGEVKPPRDESRIIFLKQKLTEQEAFSHEIYMIALYGRKDNGTGILRNKTNGGDGISGYKHTPETRKNLSDMKTGKKRKPPQWMAEVLAARDRRAAAPTFSPDGLYFLGPRYDAKWGIPDRAPAYDGLP